MAKKIVFKKEKDLPYLVVSLGNTRSNKTGGWSSLRPVLDKKKCIGCMLCWKYCPEPCIKPGKTPQIALDYCKGCGICSEVCPTNAITMSKEKK